MRSLAASTTSLPVAHAAVAFICSALAVERAQQNRSEPISSRGTVFNIPAAGTRVARLGLTEQSRHAPYP